MLFAKMREQPKKKEFQSNDHEIIIEMIKMKKDSNTCLIWIEIARRQNSTNINKDKKKMKT